MPAIETCWVGVRWLDRAIDLFEHGMRLRREAAGRLPPERLALWGLPETKARYVLLSGAGYPVGRLGLVAFDPPASGPVRDDHGTGAADSPLDIGPKALDFYVPDPIEATVDALTALGLTPRTAPKLHTMGPSRSAELLFSGVEGLPVLAMVGYGHKATSQRPGSPGGPFSEIATVSVIGDSVERTRRFYETGLAMEPVIDTPVPDTFSAIVCELIDAPPGTPIHVMSYAQPGEASGKLLTIHPLVEGRRRLAGRMRPGALGLNAFSMRVPSVEGVAERLRECGGEVLSGPLPIGQEGARALLVQGPNEECFELVEG